LVIPILLQKVVNIGHFRLYLQSSGGSFKH